MLMKLTIGCATKTSLSRCVHLQPGQELGTGSASSDLYGIPNNAQVTIFFAAVKMQTLLSFLWLTYFILPKIKSNVIMLTFVN